MNSLIPLNFESAPIRVVTIEGEPWFVGKDVAGVLGYTNPQKAVRDHCRKPMPVGVNESFTPSKLDPQTVIISEPDVLRLIVSSKLPAAERFERWVFEEVLPTIRKTGSYTMAAPQFEIPQTLPDALRLAADLADQKAVAEAEARRLSHQVAEQAPKVAALERIAGSDGGVCITNAAKDLQVRPKDLFTWLQAHGWIYRRQGGSGWVAYQARIQQGVLMHKVTVVSRSDGTEKSTEQVLVTPKGIARLAELLPGALQAGDLLA